MMKLTKQNVFNTRAQAVSGKGATSATTATLIENLGRSGQDFRDALDALMARLDETVTPPHNDLGNVQRLLLAAFNPVEGVQPSAEMKRVKHGLLAYVRRTYPFFSIHVEKEDKQGRPTRLKEKALTYKKGADRATVNPVRFSEFMESWKEEQNAQRAAQAAAKKAAEQPEDDAGVPVVHAAEDTTADAVEPISAVDQVLALLQGLDYSDLLTVELVVTGKLAAMAEQAAEAEKETQAA